MPSTYLFQSGAGAKLAFELHKTPDGNLRKAKRPQEKTIEESKHNERNG
jgi:hypothetical protein